jgi:hypothetical protein
MTSILHGNFAGHGQTHMAPQAVREKAQLRVTIHFVRQAEFDQTRTKTAFDGMRD